MSGIVPHNIYNSHPQEQQEQQQHQQQLHPQHPQNNQETIQNIVYIQADPFGEQLNINSSPLQDIYASSSSSLASASVSSPTASSSSITPTTAKVANRYQAILENLLQLRDDVVTESIRTAIKLIVKHRRNSDSTDWLRVIFKSLEILLSKINVQNISLNEKYLHDTTTVLAQVLEAGDILHLIRETSVSEDFRKLFNDTMAAILNSVSLESVYKNAFDVFANQQRESYVNVLELLDKMLSALTPSEQNLIKPVQLTFWFKNALALVFDRSAVIQNAALNVFEKILPFILLSEHQAHPDWDKVKGQITNRYIKEIQHQLQQNNSKWYRSWCICLQLLDTEIPRSATILNQFLGIVEPALRSTTMDRRAEAYLCWKVLLILLEKHKRLDTEKRLKLVCTPLKALNVKTPQIAVNKFHAWWFLLCNVQNSLDVYTTMVFEPFLQFCFGPLPPRNDSIDVVYHVKAYENVSMMACAALVCLLGEKDPSVRIILKQFFMHDLTEPVANENIFKGKTAEMIIMSCTEATHMLCKFNRVSSDEQNTDICNSLWNNLIGIINRNKNFDYIQLILENVQRLLRIENVSYKNKLIAASLMIIDKIGTNSFVFAQITYNRPAIENRSQIIKNIFQLVAIVPDQEISNRIIANVLSLTNGILCDASIFSAHCQSINEEIFSATATTSIDFQFSIWTKITAEIAFGVGDNIVCLRSLPADRLRIIVEIIFQYLYAPITAVQMDVPTELIKQIKEHWTVLADTLAELVGKREFCDQSATIISKVLQGTVPYHSYTNEIIAELLNYIDYRYDVQTPAPWKVFDMLMIVIKKDNIKSQFKELNTIIVKLLAVCSADKGNKAVVFREKLIKIVELLEKLPSTTRRVDENLVVKLRALVNKIPAKVKFESASATVASHASSKKDDDADYVVVKNVWKLQPDKLTEHQREKMKERRCDIPALYNDMSQSQDSMSIQEWTPRGINGPKTSSTLPSTSATAAKMPLPVQIKIENSPSAAAATASIFTATPASRDDDSEIPSSQIIQQPKKSKFQNVVEKQIDDVFEDDKKIRVARELAKIYIDAVETLPLDGLKEDQRKTRSAKNTEANANKSETSTARHTRSTAEKQTEKPAFDKLEQVKTRRSIITTPPTGKGASIAAGNAAGATSSGAASSASKTKAQTSNRKQYNSDSEVSESDSSQSVDKNKEVLTPVNRSQRQSRRQKGQVSSDTEAEIIVEKTNRRVAKRSASDDIQCVSPVDKKITFKENSMPIVEEEPTEIETKSKKPNGKENNVTEKISDNSNDIFELDSAENITNGNNDAMETADIELPETQENTDNDIGIAGDGISSKMSVKPLPKNIKPLSPKKSDKKTELPLTPTTMELAKQRALNNSLRIVIPDCGLSSPHNTSKENLSDVPNSQEVISSSILLNETNMSALIYNTSHDTSHLNVSRNQSIITSPCVNDEKNQEFLNDTLNISPICHEHLDERLSVTDKPQNPTTTTTAREHTEPIEKPSTPIIKSRRATIDCVGLDFETRSNYVQQSPMHTPTLSSKHPKASTPIQSVNSPVSSKLKPQLTGRGAQLLKMINARSQNDSPIASIASLSTVTSAMTQLQTAPIVDAAASPEHQPNIQPIETLRTPQMDLLTFSSVLPSPLKSPGVSILKRKACRDSIDDDYIASPANKRKRVSFNFPLSETIEYITDDQLDYDGGDNVVEVTKSSAHRAKIKLKRKNRHDSTRDINKFATLVALNNVIDDKPLLHANDDEPTIQQIPKYLDIENHEMEKMDNDQHDIDVDEDMLEQIGDENNADIMNTITPMPQMPTLTPAPITLNLFSDEQIIEHLFNKFSSGDFGTTTARLLTNKLSTVMSNDDAIKCVILEELADKHSHEFLDYALTENQSTTVCDRLITANSTNGIVESLTEKSNNDEDIRDTVLNGLLTHLSADNQEQLFDRLTDSLHSQLNVEQNNDDGPVTSPRPFPHYIDRFMAKVFQNNDLSADDFFNLTKHFFWRKFSSTDPSSILSLATTTTESTSTTNASSSNHNFALRNQK